MVPAKVLPQAPQLPHGPTVRAWHARIGATTGTTTTTCGTVVVVVVVVVVVYVVVPIGLALII